MSAQIVPMQPTRGSNDDEFDFKSLLDHVKSLKDILDAQLESVCDPDELLHIADSLTSHPHFAVRVLRQAVVLRPGDLRLMVHVGHRVLALGNAFCAFELCRQALDIDPDDEGAYWLAIEVETAILRDD